MAKEREVYINTEDVDTELCLGTEIPLEVRDLTPGREKYKWSFVHGIVSKEPGGGKDNLQVRYQRGIIEPTPYYIKVTKEEPVRLFPFSFERL